jgi:hypothetical protein
MSALVAKLVPRLDHAGSVLEAVVLEQVEFEVEGAVLGVCCVWVIPLLGVRKSYYLLLDRATYLQILRSAIPDVYSLEVRVVAIVKSSAVGVELVGEDELLLLAAIRCSRHGALRCVGIDKTVSYVTQQRLALFACYT